MLSGIKNNYKYACLTIVLFYLFIFVMEVVAGYNPLELENFSRWDSGLYATISERGYFVEVVEGVKGLQGNCGWFPLMPFLVWVIRKVSFCSFDVAAFIVSFTATFGFIITSFVLIEEFANEKISKLWAMIMVLLSVGSIYMAAAFPLSLCLFTMNISIYCVLNEKYVASGIACFFTCMSYSTAFLFCGVLGCYLIYECIKYKKGFLTLVINVLKTPVIGFMGFIAVQFIMFMFTGYSNAFFMTQEKYGHGLHAPLKTLDGFLKQLNTNRGNDSLQSFISMVFLCMFVLTIIVFIFNKMYKNDFSVICFIAMLLIYLFLLVMGNGVSPYRQYLMCSYGMFILAASDLRIWIKAPIACVLTMTSMVEIMLFFLGIIV